MLVVALKSKLKQNKKKTCHRLYSHALIKQTNITTKDKSRTQKEYGHLLDIDDSRRKVLLNLTATSFFVSILQARLAFMPTSLMAQSRVIGE